MKKIIFFLVCALPALLSAQITQTVKGKISDKDIGIGLPGVVVQVTTKGIVANTVSDNNGFFKLENIPVGRQSFLFTYTGYKTTPLRDIIVTSGKEVILNVELEENTFEIGEIEVKASKDTDVVSNMRMANMKEFSIEETERYAGSRNDPARMAANFAGVQGTNDSRNDIVIRGNSPTGLLWRLEEIDIPNPNHFAIAGSAGGPQGIINNKYLANSEFFTGAFPANYGNAIGGVFDLKMRNGNNEKHEKTFQFGFLGTEITAEGPLSKKTGATYIFSYRYSTLALFSKANINIGTSAVPGYQDVGFRLNFPTKKAGVFSFNGIGGLSKIAIVLSNTKERPKELYGDLNRDQYFATNMGAGIFNHTYSFGTKTIMKTSLAYGASSIKSEHFLVLRNKNFIPKDTLPQILGYNFYEGKTTLAWFIKSKFNSRNSIKTGFFVNRINVNFKDSIKINSVFDTTASAILNKPFKGRINSVTDFYLIQPYITYVHKFNNRLSFNGGVYAHYLTLNGKSSVEPRASFRYQINSNQVLSVAYGLHSQMQQTYLYFTAPDSIVEKNTLIPNTEKKLTNKDLDFTKSNHFVIGHDISLGKYFSVKTELFCQLLWNVPVYQVKSGVSALNRGATFTRFFPLYTMENNGTGTNYGIELTIQKSFHNHFFFMFSGSLFESKYTGSNGKTYDTDFNGNYMMNLLGGLEYNVGKNKKDLLSFSTKFTYGGGKRYSPVNIAASNAIMDVVPVDDSINTLQFNPYNRIDFRVAYKINLKKTSLELALDLINLLSTKNVLALSYSPDPADLNKSPLIENYQLGFLPLFYVRFDF
ncbi:MAG: TonB-dependent receptor [Sphingobacteriaceae bacterium]|nr:TonB-dependent receptor [Sphingobacteriaceae bacterium]